MLHSVVIYSLIFKLHMKTYKVFIDGQAGTTGLQVSSRLKNHDQIQLLLIDPNDRKDLSKKKLLMKESDLTLLCLPDHAVDESVDLANQVGTRVVDASSCNRVNSNWVYGLPELHPKQRDLIRNANRVANPGCYATGAILILRPLISEGILNPSAPISIFGSSGYTGGGNALISEFENTPSPPPHLLYGLTLSHKHIPEIQQWSNLSSRPIFVPSVVNIAQGMFVIIPIDKQCLLRPIESAIEVFTKYYFGEELIRIKSLADVDKFLTIDGTQNNSFCDIYIGQNDNQYLFISKLDNLGKGASGAAVQNINLMLNLPEYTGVHL